MITKETVINKIEITETGVIQVQRAIYVVEDGQRIGLLSYHRSAYDPGSTTMESEDPRVKAHALLAWTPEVIRAYRSKTPVGA